MMMSCIQFLLYIQIQWQAAGLQPMARSRYCIVVSVAELFESRPRLALHRD
jgi:hypothetical protein